MAGSRPSISPSSSTRSPADSVQKLEARERDEYMRKEACSILRGSAKSHYSSACYFEKFDKKVFMTALWLVESLNFAQRGDAVAVSRHLSAAVNLYNTTDGGVVVGRRDGKYEDDTPPSQCTGSGSILRAFYDSCKAVSYGLGVHGRILVRCTPGIARRG